MKEYFYTVGKALRLKVEEFLIKVETDLA